MDTKSFRDMQIQTRGKFGGLGIEITKEEGLIKVVAPIDETPAAKAGIMANDIITHINEEPVQNLTLNQAVDKKTRPREHQDQAQGPASWAGTSRSKLSITRRHHPRALQCARGWMGDDVGFIRVTQFNEQTADGLKTGGRRPRRPGAGAKLKGFVLDLRNNPGGLLDQAISVCDAFLEKGEIVSTRGRNARGERSGFSARAGRPERGQAAHRV